MPLRDEGVLIVGLGLSYHNMHAMLAAGSKKLSEALDPWLGDIMAGPPARRTADLLN
jgi:hypothetical protein